MFATVPAEEPSSKFNSAAVEVTTVEPIVNLLAPTTTFPSNVAVLSSAIVRADTKVLGVLPVAAPPSATWNTILPPAPEPVP